MKKLSKIVALLLAGALTMLLFTACGGGGSGSGTSTIGEEFENKYIAAINVLRGENAEKLENDTDLRNRALAQLAKINEDGTIAYNDANTSTVTLDADGKPATVIMISVGTEGKPDKGVCQAKEITPESINKDITTDSSDAEIVKAARALKRVGIATRVINGKTYGAVAMEISVPDKA